MFPIQMSLKIKYRTNAIPRCTKISWRMALQQSKTFIIHLKAIVKHLDRCLYKRKEQIHSLRFLRKSSQFFVVILSCFIPLYPDDSQF